MSTLWHRITKRLSSASDLHATAAQAISDLACVLDGRPRRDLDDVSQLDRIDARLAAFRAARSLNRPSLDVGYWRAAKMLQQASDRVFGRGVMPIREWSALSQNERDLYRELAIAAVDGYLSALDGGGVAITEMGEPL